MTWFQKEMGLRARKPGKISEHADRPGGGQAQRGRARRHRPKPAASCAEIITGASQDIDAKLDKISLELPRSTANSPKAMSRNWWITRRRNWAPPSTPGVGDEQEITNLVQDKVEYFKAGSRHLLRQAPARYRRERRRLILNILLAVGASFLMGGCPDVPPLFGRTSYFGIFPIVVRLAGRRLSGVYGGLDALDTRKKKKVSMRRG